MLDLKQDVVVLNTPKKGRGVFANRDFNVNEIVVVGKAIAKSPEKTWQTLQIDIDHHSKFDEPFELVNHSCDPNCGLKLNQFNGYNLVAMKPIAKGQEITFDYCMSEWISIAVPNCNCQSDLCRGSIRGGKFLSDELLQKYEGFLAPYYQKLFSS